MKSSSVITFCLLAFVGVVFATVGPQTFKTYKDSHQSVIASVDKQYKTEVAEAKAKREAAISAENDAYKQKLVDLATEAKKEEDIKAIAAAMSEVSSDIPITGKYLVTHIKGADHVYDFNALTVSYEGKTTHIKIKRASQSGDYIIVYTQQGWIARMHLANDVLYSEHYGSTNDVNRKPVNMGIGRLVQ